MRELSEWKKSRKRDVWMGGDGGRERKGGAGREEGKQTRRPRVRKNLLETTFVGNH